MGPPLSISTITTDFESSPRGGMTLEGKGTRQEQKGDRSQVKIEEVETFDIFVEGISVSP